MPAEIALRFRVRPFQGCKLGIAHCLLPPLPSFRPAQVAMPTRASAYDAIRDSLKLLDDPFTRFLDPDQYSALARGAKGSVTGNHPFPRSPAGAVDRKALRRLPTQAPLVLPANPP